jgi:hypothetical protein
MKKKKELFFFFTITSPSTFKSLLSSKIQPLVTSTKQLLSVSTQPGTAVNVAFSQRGLSALGVQDNLGDGDFSAGQVSNAQSLGDGGTSRWRGEFTGGKIHGVFLLASDTVANVQAQLSNIQGILGDSIQEVYQLQGAARPGDQEGHERMYFIVLFLCVDDVLMTPVCL